jgi:hypothetical protein
MTDNSNNDNKMVEADWMVVGEAKQGDDASIQEDASASDEKVYTFKTKQHGDAYDFFKLLVGLEFRPDSSHGAFVRFKNKGATVALLYDRDTMESEFICRSYDSDAMKYAGYLGKISRIMKRAGKYYHQRGHSAHDVEIDAPEDAQAPSDESASSAEDEVFGD